MTILVAVETLLLVLLALLVAALLRSHAEILRRLGPAEENGDREPTRSGDVLAPGLPAPPSRSGITPAADLTGTTLHGDGVQVGLSAGGPSTLLAFLSSGCLTCEGFWESFGGPHPPAIPGDARLVVVTKDSTHESPSRLRELAAPELTVVMSSAAWEAYGVPTSPYFIYVDGATGMVHGEGAASAWIQVQSLLRDAIADASPAEPATGARVPRSRGPERARRVDDELAAAGIGPEHPSLYPEVSGPERSEP